jgi:hypothetical protein
VCGRLAYWPTATEFGGVEVRIPVLCQIFKPSFGGRNQVLAESTDY